MIRFNDFSIRSKLNCLAAFTAGVALFLACASFAANDYFSRRRELTEHTPTVADVVGANCIAAISFNDSEDAAQVLSSLRLDPLVLRALLFNQQGQMVANYHRDNLSESLETPSLEFTGDRFNSRGNLEVIKVIADLDGPVGMLYVEAGLNGQAARLTRNVVLASFVFLVSFGISMAFSYRLCQIISVPITTLASTAQRISAQKDYSLRVTTSTGDEIGLLYDEFNHMLERIEINECALQAAHDELALHVAEMSVKNEKLSCEIAEREKAEHELQQLQQSFVESAHRAGKAEIATSVLHNVGNVLNSVNVSAGLVSDKVRGLGVQDLARAAEVVEGHRDDLGSYLTNDDHGKHLPQFLSDLSQHMTSEERALLDEIQSLIQNVEHVKDIVALQQSHAGVSGLVQVAALSEVIDDAVRINAASIDRHGVIVERQFEEFPPVELDRQKLLQILVNLLSNAKYAVIENHENIDKRITVRLRYADDWAHIEVEDNGMGIEREILTRIFSHGFTTRTNGHGFGLHSAALAAKEMGGSITARSNGPGKGATFALDFPVKIKTLVGQIQ